MADHAVNRLLALARRFLQWFTASLLIMLMSLTFVDVIGRYFLGQPVPGGHVLVQCLVCLLVFTGLPLVVLDDEHLRVRLLDRRMTQGQRKWRDFAVKVVIVGALAILAGQMFWQTAYFSANGEYFESIRIPVGWMAGYAAVTTGIAVLFAVASLFAGPQFDEDSA